MLDWTFGHLTTDETESALRRVGVPVDFREWSDAQQEQAIEALDAATQRKRQALLGRAGHA